MWTFSFMIGGFFLKGNVIIGEWEIFGAEFFLHYSRFFIIGDFIIGGVECISSKMEASMLLWMA